VAAERTPKTAPERVKRLLIVEDEVLVRMMIADAARDAGYRVTEVHNADAALSYLQSGRHVDLVFTDINMPGSLNGVELTKIVSAEYPDTRVIMTSGRVPANAIQSVGPFISKPYTIDDALAVIDRMLNSHPSDG
jgi:CheY-like chemotaxis protein